jgi:hypothetical protein
MAVHMIFLGFWLTGLMNKLYAPKHVKATHVNNNLISRGPPNFSKNPLLWLQHMFHTYSPAEKAGIARAEWFEKKGHGYGVLQGSKPQTLGYGLADSPVFLLAWLIEKLHDWSDK